ncbi:MAG: recombinase family protein [Kiritimatiellae bacterium]|nr:recombinase family protein [Kiritimatiellia bacterium]
MARYGYVRVSSADQNIDRQIRALTEEGIDSADIFIDRKSGRDFDRPEWRRMLKTLRQDDTVVVLSIDRMGRNYDEIRRQWQLIVHERKAHMQVLDMPLLDTRRDEGGLAGRLIGDIVLEVLAFCAHKERESIHERQAQGIAAARRRGVRFGRPRKALPENFAEIAALVAAKLLSPAEGARACRMAYTSFRNGLRQFMEEGKSRPESVYEQDLQRPVRDSCGAKPSVMVQYRRNDE